MFITKQIVPEGSGASSHRLQVTAEPGVAGNRQAEILRMRSGNKLAGGGFRFPVGPAQNLDLLTEHPAHGPIAALSAVAVAALLDDDGDLRGGKQITQSAFDDNANERPS